MKILLVLDTPTEFINGVTQSVLNLEKGLTEEGHDVRILMPSPDSRTGVKGRHYLAPSHGFSRVYPGFRFSFALTPKIRRAILRWKPDIIHSNTEGPLYFQAVRLGKKTGAKHIHTFHTNFVDFYYVYFPFPKEFTRALMTAYGRLCFRKLDGVITPSLWGKQITKGFGSSAPHFILHNGIHTEVFSDCHPAVRDRIRRRYGVKEKETLLIFVGRIAEEKNIPELIKGFCSIRSEEVKLMITGGGPELAALKKMVKSLPERDRILFTGMIPPDRVAKYYGAADVFVTASKSEVQPLTYVEAMASGLPVVCADAPYIRGLVIDGKTGFAFHRKEEFVKGIETILSSRELGRRMGERAKELVVREYGIENFAKSALRIYTEVKGGRP